MIWSTPAIMTRRAVDYDREPAKPVIDGEPIYEDIGISFDGLKHGCSIAVDVRRPLYWDLFGGACGHTYGDHAVWQFWDRSRPTPGRRPGPGKRPSTRQGRRKCNMANFCCFPGHF